MKGLILLLFILLVSCHEEEKHFVCLTCEKQIHDTTAVIDSKDCDGKALFKANCSACHNASEKKSTGPGLKGVLDRIPGGDWRYNFVRNADSLIKSGDPYAVSKYLEYNKIQHGKFPDLTNQEIDAILTYTSIRCQ